MKMRTLFLSFLVLGAGCIQAQNVVETVTKKNVLLEDFTGIHCGNCPDGHVYVNKIKLSHPDRVFPIAVHAGYYATPSGSDQPDFRTAEGETINDYYEIDSYPSGMTNRTDMGTAGLVQSRSMWTLSTRTLTYEDADVNVWVKSSYDKDTRVISTDVELYYTSDVDASSSALCVSLLQNDILGPQAGGDWEDEYVHNHVLRAMFTPVWGETIETSSQGTLVSKHYEYTLPEVIGNVETDPQHLDIVAYVINQEKEVLNVNGCEVECPGMSLPTSATLEAYKIEPSRNYGFNFFECYLVNEGTEPLTSATFHLVLDEDDELDCTWEAGEGEAIPGKQRGYVKFPVAIPATYVSGGCDSYKLKLTGLNGASFAGNTVKGSFGGMINVGGSVKATFKTDNYADDNTFRLLDADGKMVAEYGPYEEGTAETYEETIAFPSEGIYCLEVADSWGNGMLSPRGNIKIHDEAGSLLLQNNEISGFGYRAFFRYQDPAGIEAVNNEQSRMNNYDMFNVAGQKVENNYKGIVIKNGKKNINK